MLFFKGGSAKIDGIAMDNEAVIKKSAAALAKRTGQMALTRKRVLKEAGRSKAELARKGVKATTQELLSCVPEKTKLHRFLVENRMVRKEEVSLESLLAFIAVLLLQLKILLAGTPRGAGQQPRKRKKKKRRAKK